MRILVLPCDGIGPEITGATLDVLKATDKKFDLGLSFEYDECGFVSLEKYGITLRDSVLEKVRTFDGTLLGPQSHMDYPPLADGGRNVSAAFRVGLDLYANIRPARTREFIPNKAPGMDLVIMREATEGFYADRNMYKGIGEFMPTPDVAMSLRKITAPACERIARQAFKLAMVRRKKVTAVHKANNFLMTDGLFMDQVRKVAQEFPEVEFDDVIVDAMAAYIVRQPEVYDVIVTTNFYADILSDLASELSGSLGLAGSINANAETGLVCAQAQHGSAPDIAGTNTANPTSLILSAAMMLSWVGDQQDAENLMQAGAHIEASIDRVLSIEANRTADLGGTMKTDAFAEQVVAAINS